MNTVTTKHAKHAKWLKTSYQSEIEARREYRLQTNIIAKAKKAMDFWSDPNHASGVRTDAAEYIMWQYENGRLNAMLGKPGY